MRSVNELTKIWIETRSGLKPEFDTVERLLDTFEDLGVIMGYNDVSQCVVGKLDVANAGPSLPAVNKSWWA
jgi:hypothetical protein